MERSKLFKLNLRDFLKGLLMAVLTSLVTFLYEVLQAGPPVFDGEFFKSMGIVAVTALLAYLSKNLFENSEGALAKPEQ
jgi:hypothetical protein